MYKRGIKKIIMKTVGEFISRQWIMSLTFSKETIAKVTAENDPVRFAAIYSALNTIKKENIEGSFAECGVWKGYLSRFIHSLFPGKKWYLFDTFSGFDKRDEGCENDRRFRDTSLQGVMEFIGNLDNVVFRQGYFPKTAEGLEGETFSFAMLDFDKYEPTLAALEFFYPRVSKGGYIFVHDYNSPESDWACKRATDKFMAGKVEKVIELPDRFGSVVFRKL